MKSVAYISHPSCQDHEMGETHPESPARLAAIASYFQQSGLMSELVSQQAMEVKEEQLLLVHPRSHLQKINATSPQQGHAYLDGDTSMNPNSHLAAKLAAGAATLAVDEVVAGNVQRAFCAVRPPGHHAESDNPMGFCIYNNIAVAAAYALDQHQLNRVAILDFDVHHGNGTVEIFKDNPKVMVCSSFQHPFYPHRYHDLVQDNIVNTPLAAGSAELEFRAAIESQWLPALEAFKPECIFISAGFDAHRQDPLAQLNLEDEDFYWITSLISDISRRFCGDRIVSILEGGYKLEALATASSAHVRALLET